MHSNVRYMLRKNDATMPFGSGAFRIYNQEILLIHLFIHQINSL
jgi:hypothetical protein